MNLVSKACWILFLALRADALDAGCSCLVVAGDCKFAWHCTSYQPIVVWTKIQLTAVWALGCVTILWVFFYNFGKIIYSKTNVIKFKNCLWLLISSEIDYNSFSGRLQLLQNLKNHWERLVVLCQLHQLIELLFIAYRPREKRKKLILILLGLKDTPRVLVSKSTF